MAGGGRRRWILVATAVVVWFGAVTAGALLLVLPLLQVDPGPASVDEAVEDFTGGDDEGGGGEAPTRFRPDEGVYVYAGTGSESLSIPPLSHDQGPAMPATVTHRPDGCWRFRIELHEAHWQEWHYCSEGEALVESGGRTYQAWNVGVTTIANTSTFRCPDSVVIRAGAEPGDRWRQECRGTSDTVSGATVSAGPTEFVGEETVTVGDEDVPALHYHQVRRMSDAQSGPQVEDFWFRATDGLPLRNTRSASVDSDSPVGAITYSEEGQWHITSLQPRT